MTLNFWSSCFHLLSAGIIGLYYYTWIMWSWRQNSGPFSYSASTLNWATALTPGKRTVLKMKRAYYTVFVNEDCLKLTKILILVMNGNTLWYHRPSPPPWSCGRSYTVTSGGHSSCFHLSLAIWENCGLLAVVLTLCVSFLLNFNYSFW